MAETRQGYVGEGEGALDRISTLPRDIIDQILERMPPRDAARTGVLSSTWRYIWANHPRLLLTGIRSSSRTYLVNTVNKILLQHYGPILKFALNVSMVSSVQFFHNIDGWLLFLSRNGVRELILDNSRGNSHYKLPSCLFNCPELTDLSITNCILKAPRACEGFSKIKKLILERITLESSVLSTPLLVYLSFQNCKGVQNFRIHAPILEQLSLLEVDLEFEHYTTSRDIRSARIFLAKQVKHHGQGERFNLTKLPVSWPRITELFLDNCSFKNLAEGTAPDRLPTALNNLRHLELVNFNFNLLELTWILCLLQSCPGLHEFVIEACSVVSNDIEALKYLEEQGRINLSLEQLHTVKIKFFMGSKVELLFVELLLSCSPSLECLLLVEGHGRYQNEWLRIAKELVQFSRASTKAKVIFKN